jgi:hypothetical protein
MPKNVLAKKHRRQNVAHETAEEWRQRNIERGRIKKFSEFDTVDPERAYALLGNEMCWNEGNRKAKQKQVNILCNAITRGYSVTGETIIVSKEGVLNTGQKRCLAVIKTGMTIETNIAWGVDRSAADVTDQVEPYKGHDILTRHGVGHPIECIAVATLLLQYEATGGRYLARPNIFSRPQFADRVLLDKAIGESVAFVIPLGPREVGGLSVPAFCHYLFVKKNRSMADTFTREAVSGIDLRADTPTHRLRKQLLAAKLERAVSAPKAEIMIRQWNNYRIKGPDAKVGYVRPTGLIPPIR